ncbi:IclR family transcriptional regulator [Celeribacter litoreus]|uniref:IclR family transcriptional regulator n=1 Tax=Celeribacter litoreus TaxID=2876714 RepID=UPI001CCFD88E|nr:IclR family transcriptional regulator C-terminal domain-containing protein [Celeribacter litoreus]MCA0043520.1 helix-turn-helix domain-containing protein [Celeribacter litoreus]
MAEGSRGIQSVEVSGRILRAFVKTAEPMMLKDLAELADLKPAQCHAYLTSLKNVGLVHQDWATGYYSPGPLALRLGVSWLRANPQTSRAIDGLKALTETYGVMSLITVWGEFGPTIAHTYAGLTQATLNLRQGSIFSVTGTAAGRLFPAYGKNPAIEALCEAEIARKSEHLAIGEQITREAFSEKIEEVRACGYAIAEGRPIPGINAIGAPVFSETGDLAFVISMIGKAENLSTEAGSDTVENLLSLAKDLSPDTINNSQQVPA